MAENNSMDDDTVQKQKDIEYFSALVTAWLNTRLEKDRSLLALSVGAIGLLVTFLTTIGPSSTIEVVLYLCAFIFYLITNDKLRSVGFSKEFSAYRASIKPR